MPTDAAFYGPEARKTYVSIRAALVLPAGFAFLAGLYTGLLAGSLLWLFGAPGEWVLKASAVAASTAAALAWLGGVRWWQLTVRGIEYDLYHLQQGQYAAAQPVQIEHRVDGGRVLQIARPPATRYQMQAVARIVLDGGSVSHRNLSGIFSAGGVGVFQTWLVSQGYAAWRNAEAPTMGIEVTSAGMAMFRQAAGVLANSPTPGVYDGE